MTTHITDGKWRMLYSMKNYEIIAWKPLPEPFRGKVKGD